MSTLRKVLNLKYKIERDNTLSPSEIEFIRNCLTLKSIDDMDIYQESDTLVMLTFQISLFQILRELAMQNIIDSQVFKQMVDICLERITYPQEEQSRIRKLKKEMDNIVIDICLKMRSRNIYEVMNEYLQKEEINESLGVCFLLLTDTQPKNKKLRILKNLEPKEELVEVLKEISGNLRKEFLNILFISLRDKIKSVNDRIYILALIEINKILKREDTKMLEFLEKNINKIEHDYIFIELLKTLIYEEESRIRALKILNNSNILDDVFNALETIQNLNRIEVKEIRPEDSKMISTTLSVLYKIKEEVIIQRHIELLIHSIKLSISTEIKKEILKNLSLISVSELNRIEELIFSYLDSTAYEIFEGEKRKNNFYFTEGFLILCNNYIKNMNEAQINLSEEIIKYSTFTMISGNEELIKYTLQMIFELKNKKMQKIGYYEILKYTVFLKEILSDNEILESLLEFFSKEKNTIKIFDISFIMNISYYSSINFYKFISTFPIEEISPYFTIEFLDQLAINKEEGIKYFIENSKEINTSKFIKRNIEWFNRFIIDSNEEYILEGIIKIYNNVQNNYNDIKFNLLDDNNAENIDMKDFNKNDNIDKNNIDKKINNIFLLPRIYNDEFFEIFTKITLLTGEIEESLKNIHPGLIRNCIKGYSSFIKSRIIIRDNVEQEIKDLLNSELPVDDLLAFYKLWYKIPVFTNSYSKLSYQIILSSKNDELFLTYFPESTIFEKYLLFSVLEKPSNEIKYLIQNEIIHILEIKEKSKEEIILLEACYYGLLHFNDIEEVMVLINALVKESNYILLLLSIKNILNGGETVIRRGKVDLELERMCYQLMKVKGVGNNREMREWGKLLSIEN
ncbi:hypothetical protein SLOPH_2349 [Spraguea lophii 42_110]|uniref:Uncharacterized protein n=1 Tax=Spraguea lophii (strain 42_110) TaxID=1358809 RepID=S7XL27_SPRLO|nr:hypothetical protein SLOPH_2349 [Spraguea lophii 42_110]